MATQSTCMQVVNSVALVSVVQGIAYGVANKQKTQRAFLCAQVNKLWKHVYKLNNDDKTTTDVTMVFGSESLIDWGINSGLCVSNKHLAVKYAAIRSGLIVCLNHLVDKCDIYFYHSGYRVAAAMHGHVHVLQWLEKHKSRSLRTTRTYFEHQTFKQWSQANCFDWTAVQLEYTDWNYKSYYLAGYFGHVMVVEWLIDHECKHSGVQLLYTLEGATDSGNIQTLVWLKQNNHKWCSEYSCFDAIKKGRVDLLQWFRAQGCSWGFKMATNSALYETEAGQWARAEGCPVRRL
jgi:hypothetical protein